MNKTRTDKAKQGFLPTAVVVSSIFESEKFVFTLLQHYFPFHKLKFFRVKANFDTSTPLGLTSPLVYFNFPLVIFDLIFKYPVY